MQPQPVVEGPNVFALGGVMGIVVLLVGLAVLALGIRVAMRRGARRHALAIFAAAWLVVPLGIFGRAMGEAAALNEIVRFGPAVTPKDMAAGLRYASAGTAWTVLALLLGLVGSIAALARSREDAAETA